METLQGSEPHVTIPGKPYPVTVLGYPARMIGPATTYESVSDQIGDVPLKHPHQKAWLAGFTVRAGVQGVRSARDGGIPTACIPGWAGRWSAEKGDGKWRR